MPPRAGAGESRHLDVAIAELAGGQHGVVSRRQLLAVGATKAAIRHRLAVKRLRHVHRGVYAVGHQPLAPPGRYLAAVMACGSRAVLSHRSAAALWGLRPASGAIDVTVPRRGGVPPLGIALHTTRALDADEITARDGVPCTTVARTLLDLAGVVNAQSLERALEQSLVLRLFDLTALEAVLARANGRSGSGMLRGLLAALADDPAPVRSELERRFIELVRDAGLPTPVVNGLVCGYEVDFHWPAQRVVVETDGRATHDTAWVFERDRQRDLELELAGWHVIRISWRQLTEERARIIALLAARLAAAWTS